MDLGDKLVWLVIFAGIATAIIFVVIKVGYVAVKRRTDALIAEYAEEDTGSQGDGEGPKT